jgi:hypothetical protein
MNTAPSKHYLIDVYHDMEFKKYLYGIPNKAKNRKQAIKIMNDEKHKDLTQGRYFFYLVTEQKNTIIDYTL